MIIGADSPSRTIAPQKHLPEVRGIRRLVNPFRCRVWTQHSRPEEQLTDSACRSLRESIEKHGQHQPALGRPVKDDPDCDIEIICGARRHAVAQGLGRDFLVEVRPMTDAEAYVAMYEENLLRKDDSPYVRAKILSAALRSGTYASQEELGRAFNLSHSGVSRLLMLGQLPSVIVAAFSNPDEIREAWGIELFHAWSDQHVRDTLSTRARALANRPKRPPARVIYEMLLSTGLRKRQYRSYRNIPVRGRENTILFHEQDRLETVIYSIPKRNLSPSCRETVKQSLIRILDGDSDNTPLGHSRRQSPR
ncbi:MAG TPA: ParB/RepB/Spo0J family partition protein [Steroidobacteraceae bacterium]|nr:ParB/RepB/Spo0J family partition protein [Steroidobacteraceae bacterium]